jgi:hypothetical protein
MPCGEALACPVPAHETPVSASKEPVPRIAADSWRNCRRARILRFFIMFSERWIFHFVESWLCCAARATANASLRLLCGNTHADIDTAKKLRPHGRAQSLLAGNLSEAFADYDVVRVRLRVPALPENVWLQSVTDSLNFADSGWRSHSSRELGAIGESMGARAFPPLYQTETIRPGGCARRTESWARASDARKNTMAAVATTRFMSLQA